MPIRPQRRKEGGKEGGREGGNEGRRELESMFSVSKQLLFRTLFIQTLSVAIGVTNNLL